MSKNPVIIPEELKNAPLDIKKEFISWHRLGDELDNHPLRFYEISDKNGDTIKVDCKGIWANNIKRIKRLGAYSKEAEEEIKKRSKVFAEIKTKKGHHAARYNNWLNKNTRGKDVLDFRREDVLEQFGKYKNVHQVYELIKEWGFATTEKKVKDFYYNNLDDIQNRRVHFQAQEGDFYLSTGTGRIESLSYLHSELVKLFEQTKNRGYAAEARQIIEQVRKEVKGDEIRLTVDGKIDITATVQANRTIQELNQKIPINMFIISLVAAKKGINPQSIMAQLGNSFYANYNGFNKMAGEDEEMKLPSHFINSYDWQDIERIHKEKEDKATNRLLDNKLKKFFKENEVKYDGNMMEAVRQLEARLRGEAVPEIVDIEPLEIEIIPQKKEEVKSKRDILKKMLEEKMKKIEN